MKFWDQLFGQIFGKRKRDRKLTATAWEEFVRMRDEGWAKENAERAELGLRPFPPLPPLRRPER